MDAIPLSAREHLDRLLLITPLEAEPGAIGASVYLTPPQLDRLVPPADLLLNRLLSVQGIAALIRVSELSRRSRFPLPGRRGFLSRNHAEERRLSRPVGPHDTDDAAARQVEAQPVDQKLVAVSLAQVLGDNHLIAQPWSIRDDDLCAVQLLAGILVE